MITKTTAQLLIHINYDRVVIGDYQPRLHYRGLRNISLTRLTRLESKGLIEGFGHNDRIKITEKGRQALAQFLNI